MKSVAMCESTHSIEECQLPPWLHPSASKQDARQAPAPRLVCHRDIAREYMACAVYLSANNVSRSVLERLFTVDDDGGRVRIRRKYITEEVGADTCAKEQVANTHSDGLKCETYPVVFSQICCAGVRGVRRGKEIDNKVAGLADDTKAYSVKQLSKVHEMVRTCIGKSRVHVCKKVQEVFAPKSLSDAVDRDKTVRPDAHVDETEALTDTGPMTRWESSDQTYKRPLPKIPCNNGAGSTSVIKQANRTKMDTESMSRTAASGRIKRSRASAAEITITKDCRRISNNLRQLRFGVSDSVDRAKDDMRQFDIIDCLLKAHFHKVLNTLQKNRKLYEKECQACEKFQKGKTSFHAFYSNRLMFVSTAKQVDELRMLMKHDLTGKKDSLFPNEEERVLKAIFQHIVALLDLMDAVFKLRTYVTHIKKAIEQENMCNFKLLADISGVVNMKNKVLAEFTRMKMQNGTKINLNSLRGNANDGCSQVNGLSSSHQWTQERGFQPELSRDAVSAIQRLEAHLEFSLKTARLEPIEAARSRHVSHSCLIL